MSSMEVNIDMLEQMDLMDISDQEALDVFLNSGGEDNPALSPVSGGGDHLAQTPSRSHLLPPAGRPPGPLIRPHGALSSAARPTARSAHPCGLTHPWGLPWPLELGSRAWTWGGGSRVAPPPQHVVTGALAPCGLPGLRTSYNPADTCPPLAAFSKLGSVGARRRIFRGPSPSLGSAWVSPSGLGGVCSLWGRR